LLSIVWVDKSARRYQKEEEYYGEGGAYLPLCVWQKKGWDIDLIREKSRPEDIRYMEQGGEVYRVRIMSAGLRGVKGLSDFAKKHAQGRRSKIGKLAAAEEKQGEPGEAPPPSPGSDSDSDISSSSDSDRHRRKDKKDKKRGKKDKKRRKEQKRKEKLARAMKEEKEKAKDQKKLEKAEEARMRIEVDTATKLKTKATQILTTLNATVNSPAIVHIPPTITSPVATHVKRLKSIIAECDKVVAHPDQNRLPDNIDLEDKKVKSDQKLLVGMLATVERAMLAGL